MPAGTTSQMSLGQLFVGPIPCQPGECRREYIGNRGPYSRSPRREAWRRLSSSVVAADRDFTQGRMPAGTTYLLNMTGLSSSSCRPCDSHFGQSRMPPGLHLSNVQVSAAVL